MTKFSYRQLGRSNLMQGLAIPRLHSFEDADPDSVIVTLYCAHGMVRGWFIGPPSFNPAIPMCWHTSEKDNLLGAIALVRALQIATCLQIKMNVVDPENLWSMLSNYIVS